MTHNLLRLKEKDGLFVRRAQLWKGSGFFTLPVNSWRMKRVFSRWSPTPELKCAAVRGSGHHFWASVLETSTQSSIRICQFQSRCGQSFPTFKISDFAPCCAFGGTLWFGFSWYLGREWRENHSIPVHWPGKAVGEGGHTAGFSIWRKGGSQEDLRSRAPPHHHHPHPPTPVSFGLTDSMVQQKSLRPSGHPWISLTILGDSKAASDVAQVVLGIKPRSCTCQHVP